MLGWRTNEWKINQGPKELTCRCVFCGNRQQYTHFPCSADSIFLTADLDRTMCTAFIRRSFFQAVLNSAPTFLDQAEESIRLYCIAKIVGLEETKWENSTSLDPTIYNAWLEYLKNCNRSYCNSENDTAFLNSVQTTQQLRIYGKIYSSHTKHKGNSRVEFHMNGKNRYGNILFHFRKAGISLTFIAIEPYVSLDLTDSPNDFYRHHPQLHAEIVYQRTEAPVVIATKELCGHIVLCHWPAETFAIPAPTYSVVSLRNIYSD